MKDKYCKKCIARFVCKDKIEAVWDAECQDVGKEFKKNLEYHISKIERWNVCTLISFIYGLGISFFIVCIIELVIYYVRNSL